jgi:hypothetical protein
MSLLFNLSAAVISVIILILLCIIVQKNIVSEVIPPVQQNKQGEIENTQNNPYGNQYNPDSKQDLRTNLQYVSNCPDYWTPYYDNNDNNGNYVCVSDNPYYNNKLEETLNKALPTHYIQEFDSNNLTLKNGFTRAIINNMKESSVVSQNKKLYYIPQSSKLFTSGSGSGTNTHDSKSAWNAKCNWTQQTCLPWSGINSSHTEPQKNEKGDLVTCEISPKCLNHNLIKPQKPQPGIDTSKHPIYFYNYSLGNNEAVNTNYIPNLYDTNLLQDRSVDQQRATGLLGNDPPHPPQHHRTKCNPNSTPPQLCPDGTACPNCGFDSCDCA